MAAKLKAAAGLAHLDGRRYKQAARAFVDVSPELGTNYSDVRVYACACACACACARLCGGLLVLRVLGRLALRSCSALQTCKARALGCLL
jgi:COP9 signalosome complex subunit 1